MKHNDEFVPETLEEQIDQFAYSLNEEPLSSNAQIIQELHAYYKEDQHSIERMWERLAPYATKHESTIVSASDQSEILNAIFEERLRSKKPARKPRRHSARWKGTPHLALIAAVFCTSLIIGSLLFVFQMVHSVHTGSYTSPFNSLYISRGGEISRIDLQTRKTIWHTVVPKSDPGDIGNLVVFQGTVYLSLTSYIYALNTSDGYIRWSDKISSYGFPLNFVDDLLYVHTALHQEAAIYALNSLDGKIEATYMRPNEFPGGSAMVNGILYSATPTDLYAITLTNQHVVWHQHYYFGSSPRIFPIEVREVKNGIVYVQATVHTSKKIYQIIMAFDATTGKKLWQLNNAGILATTDNTVYTTEDQHVLTSSALLNAIDAHTGKVLWHQSINPPKIQTASDWYIVMEIPSNSDTFYVSYENISSLLGGIIALKASNGTQLWQANVNGKIADSPLNVQNGIIYTATYANKSSTIDALKASDGSRLWQMPLPTGDPWQVIIA